MHMVFSGISGKCWRRQKICVEHVEVGMQEILVCIRVYSPGSSTCVSQALEAGKGQPGVLARKAVSALLGLLNGYKVPFYLYNFTSSLK